MDEGNVGKGITVEALQATQRSIQQLLKADDLDAALEQAVQASQLLQTAMAHPRELHWNLGCLDLLALVGNALQQGVRANESSAATLVEVLELRCAIISTLLQERELHAASPSLRRELIQEGGQEALTAAALWETLQRPAREHELLDKSIQWYQALRQAYRDDGQEAEWTRRFANDLASAHMNRGALRQHLGQFQPALVDHGQAIALGEALRQAYRDDGQDAEWTAHFANDLATAYSNRGVLRRELGQSQPALADHDHAIALGEALRRAYRDDDQDAEWTRRFGNDLASAYNNRGNTFLNPIQSQPALEDYSQAVELREALRQAFRDDGDHAEWTVRFARDLANVYYNRGVAHAKSGQIPSALHDFSQAIALLEAVRQTYCDRNQEAEWTVPFAKDLADAYRALGKTLHGDGQTPRALGEFDRAIRVMEALHQTCIDQGSEDAWSVRFSKHLVTAFFDSAKAAGHDRDRARWRSDLRAALELLDLPATFGTEQQAIFADVMAEAMSDPAAFWTAPEALRQQTHPLLEWAESIPTSSKTAEHQPLLSAIRLFHLRWLSFALERGDFNELPRILAALSGRELLLDAVASIELPQSDVADARLTDFKRRRQELLEIRQQIQHMTAEMEAQPAVADQRLQGLLQQEADCRAHLDQAREEAAEVPGFEALGHPHDQVELATLQACLGTDEGLLLLTPALRRVEAGETIEVSEEGDEVEATLAILVRREGHPRIHWLPPSDDLVQQMNAASDQLSAGPLGLRLGGRSSNGAVLRAPSEASNVQRALNGLREIEGSVQASLWAPLREQGLLDGLTRLTVSTHGPLHLVPWIPAAIDDLSIVQAPGLVPWWLGRQRATATTDGHTAEPGNGKGIRPRFGLYAHPGADRREASYLWAAPLEAVVIRGLQRHRFDIVQHEPAGGPLQLHDDLNGAHFLCHGDVQQISGGGLIARLLLTEEPPQLSSQQILLSPAGLPGEVLATACLVGQILDSDRGTPSGLPIAMLMRGAHTVVGSLLPIDDRAGLWFATLTHLYWQKMPLAQAARHALEDLASGNEGAFDRTRNAIREQLEAALPAPKPGEGGRPAWEWVREGWGQYQPPMITLSYEGVEERLRQGWAESPEANTDPKRWLAAQIVERCKPGAAEIELLCRSIVIYSA